LTWLKLFLVVDSIRVEITSNVAHVKLIKLSGFTAFMGPFLLSYYVGVYLFLINLTGEHSDYKLVHVSVFV
jgi:hypothetical protein